MAANRKSPQDRGVTRSGSSKRRKLEFLCIRDQVRRRKAAFIARLEARTTHDAETGCRRYRATCSDGYPLITFKFQGQSLVMKVHRVFAILRNCAPIPVGMDVGHLPHCKNRDCVAHTQLQPVKENAAQSNRDRC